MFDKNSHHQLRGKDKYSTGKDSNLQPLKFFLDMDVLIDSVVVSCSLGLQENKRNKCQEIQCQQVRPIKTKGQVFQCQQSGCHFDKLKEKSQWKNMGINSEKDRFRKRLKTLISILRSHDKRAS